MNAAEIHLFLDGPVLLGWPSGCKGNNTFWGHRTRAHMTPEYLCALDAGNIGLAHGERSCSLCSVDADTDAFLAGLLEANPALRETWQTRGARGRNLHFRCHGKSPKSRNWKGRGELRSNGLQTIIAGIHPSGCRYTYPNGWQKPVTLDPGALLLPDGKPMCPELHGRNVLLLPVSSVTQSSFSLDCVTSPQGEAKRRYELRRPPAVWAKVFVADCFARRKYESDGLLWKLARRVKQHNASMSERELREVFSAWWNESYRRVDRSYPSDWYYEKLIRAYRNAAVGTPVVVAFAQVSAANPGAEPYEKLALLGNELADQSGTFFLDCRLAGTLLGVSHTTASRWMHSLWTMLVRGQFRGDSNIWQTKHPAPGDYRRGKMKELNSSQQDARTNTHPSGRLQSA